MKSWIAKKALERFAGRYGYDVSYMTDMLKSSPAAFFKFARIMAVSQHRSAVPIEAYFATKLVAAVSADCGPCTQLCVEMAKEAGLSAREIEAVLGDRVGELTDAGRLGAEFGQALAYGRGDLGVVRSQVREAWGDEAVVELSLCFAFSKVFPTVKTGMGYGEECRMVTVSAQAVEVVRHGVHA